MPINSTLNIPSLPRTAATIRGYFRNADGSLNPHYQSGGYALTPYTGPLTEPPSRWQWDNAPDTLFDNPAWSTVSYIDYVEGTEILGRWIRATNAEWSATDEIAYTIQSGRWMIDFDFGATVNPYYGLRSLTGNGWIWVRDFYDRDQAGWGWHGQDRNNAGFDHKQQPVNLRFCRVYGRSRSLSDKVKVEEAKILTANSMPSGLVFNDRLNLSRWAPLSYVALPAELTINGGVDLSRTNFGHLPTSWQIGGNVDASETLLSEIPNYLPVVGWDFHGGNRSTTSQVSGGVLRTGWLHHWSLPEVAELNAADTCVFKIPDAMNCGGVLDLSGCPIRRIPNGVVAQSIILRRCWLDTIPSDLTCDVLDLTQAVVKEWPNDLPNVGEIVWTGGKKRLPSAIVARLRK